MLSPDDLGVWTGGTTPGTWTGLRRPLNGTYDRHAPSGTCNLCPLLSPSRPTSRCPPPWRDRGSEALWLHGILLLRGRLWGEAPDNATTFHETLMESSEPSMENVHYSILALGDSEYVDFCKCGKDFDQAFTARGAKTLSPRVDVDVDPDDPFDEWITAVLEKLAALKS